MNSKLLSLITATLATSVWLPLDQEAFAGSVEFQSNPVKESEVLVPKVSSSKGMSRGLSLSRKEASADRISAVSEESLSMDTPAQKNKAIANNLADGTVQVGNTLGGLFTAFFIGSIIIGLLCTRKRTTRSAILLRQIEMLERIWAMESYRHR
jgi:hypothetical protein